MGAFNTLITDLKCENCAYVYSGRVQFKFGDKWKHEYKIGDKIGWGGNDEGVPNLWLVKVYGILENEICPNCKHQNPEEFDIYLSRDIIKEVQPLLNITDYDLGDGSYQVVIE